MKIGSKKTGKTTSPKGKEMVDKHIASFPPATRKKLSELRKTIRAILPQAEEKIAYGIPTYFWMENVVHFAGFKGHIGFFPSTSPIAHFKKELSGYDISKGTIRFPLEGPLPLALVKRILKFRVREIRLKFGL